MLLLFPNLFYKILFHIRQHGEADQASTQEYTPSDHKVLSGQHPTAFDDKFIVDMAYDKAVGESTDGVHEDVSAYSLDDIFHEFRTVAF